MNKWDEEDEEWEDEETDEEDEEVDPEDPMEEVVRETYEWGSD